MALSVSTSEGNGHVVVSVEGEVDVSNAAELRSALDAALEGNVSTVEADLSQVSYIDSTGIGVLVGFAHRAADLGIGYGVANPQRNVRRVLSLLGVESELNVHADENPSS